MMINIHKLFLVILVFFISNLSYSQIDQQVYKLNSLDSLLSNEVKEILSLNLRGKEVIFLGEATHYNGSDFLAKTEFIKFLVNTHNFKDIAFESDFFALLFDHDKRNLYPIWRKSEQCSDLFSFLEEKGVTIWGFDNKLYTMYSYKNLTNKISELLRPYKIYLDDRFVEISKSIIKNQYESLAVIPKDDIQYTKSRISEILSKEDLKTNDLLRQILESYSSAVDLYTIKDNKSDRNRIPIRDRQMAKNLNFLVQQNTDKKFIVWSANAHMSKLNSETMNGQTMGYQFRKLYPNISYHVAFSSILMPEREEKKILKAKSKDHNILSLLPPTNGNYFVDSKNILKLYPELNNKKYNDFYIFNLHDNKTRLLNHFDALVFINKGIEASYEK